MKKLVNWCGKSALNAAIGILSIALVVCVWYQASPLIVILLDFNLQVIKAGSSLLPAPYGAMAESALRGALAADKAFLFAEGSLAIKGALWGLRLLFTRRYHTEAPEQLAPG